ncbi:MAG TPA: hypothetical protein PLS63_08190 [Microthrixaceae bacterium]|nr:hypothetical protein [Microthrixaceae bacterium]
MPGHCPQHGALADAARPVQEEHPSATQAPRTDSRVGDGGADLGEEASPPDEAFGVAIGRQITQGEGV